MSKEELAIIFIASALLALCGLWRAYWHDKRCKGQGCGKVER